MLKQMGFKHTNLKDKCYECKHYKPVRKVCHRTKIDTVFARGRCLLTDNYKQRTETCKKIERVE